MTNLGKYSLGGIAIALILASILGPGVKTQREVSVVSENSATIDGEAFSWSVRKYHDGEFVVFCNDAGVRYELLAGRLNRSQKFSTSLFRYPLLISCDE